MPTERDTRRLTAILAADVAGYSRLMAAAEAATLARLKAHRFELIDPAIAKHSGRIFKTTGDGLLAEFGSAVDAVECAVEIQTRMARRNAEMPADSRIDFRIGINVGDVIVDGEDLLGDGVNVAARLEGIAEPGGVVISRSAREQVRDKVPYTLDEIGEVELKNIPRPVRAFRVRAEGSPIQARSPSAPALRFVATHAALAAAVLVAAAGIAVGALWWQQSNRPAPARALAPPAPVAAQVPAPADRPSIAVLAFANLSDDPQQDYLSDGISEDILTALTRFSALKVIARNSSFQYKGKSVDIARIGRELGAKYVLEGSLRRSGDQIRLTAQLIEAATNAHIWAERYERPMREIFAIQDELVNKIAGSLAAHLDAAETAEARRKPPSDLSAYDLVLQARETFYLRSSESVLRARDLLDQAIKLDPGYAEAYVWRARIQRELFSSPLNSEYAQRETTERAAAFAKQAIALEPRSSAAHAVHAMALVDLGQVEAARDEIERALALNSHDARMLGFLLSAVGNLGQHQRSLRMFETIRELDPNFPPSLFTMVVRAQIGLGNDTEALVAGRTCVQRLPTFSFCHIANVAALGWAGSEAERKAAVAELLKIAPTFSVSGERRRSANFPDRVATERYLEGLRRSGVPE